MFAAHAALGTRHGSQIGVARAVREEFARKFDPVLFGRLDGYDRTDRVAHLLDLGDGITQEKCDILLGEHHFELLVILVVVGAAGVADAVGADLVEQVTQRRIGIDVDLAAQSDTHLRRVVAAQHVTILHERHLAAQTGGRQRRTDTRNASADHDEIEFALVHRRFGAEQPCAQGAVLIERIARHFVGSGQHDGVAAAVEARQVVQCEGVLALFESDLAAPLPVPVDLVRAEGRRVGHTVDEHLKDARRRAVGPVFRPVFGTHQQIVLAVGGYFDGRHRIALKRRADAVRQQIGGAHLEDELLFDRPVAPIGEGRGERHDRIVRVHRINWFFC